MWAILLCNCYISYMYVHIKNHINAHPLSYRLQTLNSPIWKFKSRVYIKIWTPPVRIFCTLSAHDKNKTDNHLFLFFGVFLYSPINYLTWSYKRSFELFYYATGTFLSILCIVILKSVKHKLESYMYVHVSKLYSYII